MLPSQRHENLLIKERQDRVNEEARIANDLQASTPGLSRTEALKVAKRALESLASRK